ncbi:MAG: LTA synthase family protein, partial [Xanthomonadales bacterium]|nr:LTA synthase family protein [Xanthomonadales bacterium]
QAARALLGGKRPEREVAGGPREGRNVVLVIVESWSSWHSEAFGGYENWTPQLDAAARRGVRLEDFHAVAYSTERGLVGLLAGQDLWAPFHSWLKGELFYGLWGLRPSLASVFTDADYHAAFLTTGPLSLYRKGEWLRSLGFDETEGGDHPFYEGLPRFAFGAPSDQALYARALQWQAQAEQPYLLVLETVTTHQPYEDPESGELSLERAMRYADAAFGEYLRALEAAGFFENGVLLAASDHRSMTPIPAEDVQRFGFSAPSRVPAFLLDPRQAPRRDTRVLSHSDLVPSFQWWLHGEVTLGAHDALLFESADLPPRPGPCAFHLRGDVPGVLNVICPDGHGEVRMEGDATRFLSYDGLDAARRDSLIEHIGRRRLATQARHLANPAPESTPESSPEPPQHPSEEDAPTP